MAATGAVTNLGKKAIVGLTGDIDTQTAFGYVANGSGSTDAAAAQTALVSENSGSGSDRAAVTPTSEQTTSADDTLRYSKTWTFSGSKTLREFGIFNASSDGVMLARYVLASDKSLASGETYTITFDVIIA